MRVLAGTQGSARRSAGGQNLLDARPTASEPSLLHCRHPRLATLFATLSQNKLKISRCFCSKKGFLWGGGAGPTPSPPPLSGLGTGIGVSLEVEFLFI